MNTFTAQDIKEHYDNYMGYMSECHGNNPQTFPEWLDELYKPTKKVIDLSVLIESGIDCEFSDHTNFHLVLKRSLIEARETGTGRFRCELRDLWKYCRPRMNHKHAWLHNNCPIEGFVVRAWFDKEDFTTVDTSFNIINWNNVIWVEFLELEDGYVMPWEQDV